MELISWKDPSVRVASGMVLSANPEMIVMGQKLGTGFLEVYIEVAMLKDEPLIRPFQRFKKIGDAIARGVAWPSSLVCEVSLSFFLFHFFCAKMYTNCLNKLLN